MQDLEAAKAKASQELATAKQKAAVELQRKERDLIAEKNKLIYILQPKTRTESNSLHIILLYYKIIPNHIWWDLGRAYFAIRRKKKW